MVRKIEEKLILEELKRIEPIKYENAFFAEVPDIQTTDKSVGVEIVRADYEELIISSKTLGKDIINARKMMGDKPLKDCEIELILKYQRVDALGNHISLQDAEKCRYLYVVNNGNKETIKEIADYYDLREKYIKYDIWEFENSTFNSLGVGYKVIIGRPKCIWVDNWYKLFIKRIDSKIDKFSTYNRYKENNLAIVSIFNYDDDIEQISLHLEKYYKDKYMPFDNIYIFFWESNKFKILNFNK